MLASIWNHLPKQIDPIAFSIGFFSVRWYSLMYLVAFATIFFLLKFRKSKNELPVSRKISLDELFVFLILGLLIGGRMGYLILYQFEQTITQPLQALSPFENGSFVGYYGISYHGGLVGIVFAGFVFSKLKKINFANLADFIIPAIPLGYFFGRIGNFLNGELFGRVTNSNWGMFFPLDQTGTLRHPSQLYEAFFEGIVIFLILWSQRNNPRFQGKFLPFYLVLYGITRFSIEFFRQPDPQLGNIIWELTMGQILSLLMVIVGSLLYQFQNLKNKKIQKL